MTDDRVSFLRGVMDAFFPEACLVARSGELLLVNEAWRVFAEANQGDPVRVGEGANYLEVCDRALLSGDRVAGRFAEGLRGALEGRLAAFELEYPCPTPSRERWFIGMTKPLVIGGERYALVSHLEVTPRKLAERSTFEAHQRLRRLLDTLPDIVYEMDLDGRLTDWNRALEVVTGYSHEELQGCRAVDLFAEEDRPAIAEAIQAKFRLGESTAEGRLRTKDGQLRRYHWFGRALTDETGRLKGATGIGRDVTAQRQAEEQLKRSEAMLAEAQRLAHLGSWDWGIQANRVSWSEELFRILGLDPAQVTPSQERYVSLVCPEDRERLERAVADALDQRHPFEIEYRICRPDGSVRVVLGRGRVITDRHGQVERMLGTIQDITEIKAMDQQIRLQYEDLKELDRLKGAFVNSVTHELRTPLTSIMGFAEFLEDEIGGPLSSQQHDFVAQLQGGAKRLENLLNDLLDFARLQAGTFKLALREGDLSAKIRESLDSLRPQALEAHVDLAVELPPEPLIIAADHERIGQVLINLIGNAIKFTPAGGFIKVRARREGDEVRCEVIDTGIGIAPADRHKLFRRFTQLEPGIRSGSGAGLGLSISKSIVDAHGGRIGVESEPSKGSTFWFVLPVHPA